MSDKESSMERKDRDFHDDHETNSKTAEPASYMEEHISTNEDEEDEEDVENRLDKLSGEYDNLKKENNALKKRLGEAKERLHQLRKERIILTKTLGEARGRLNKIEQSFQLTVGTEPGAGSSGAGGSDQEAGDVKMVAQGNQSGENIDVRTGVERKGEDLVVPGGGDSGESEEQKKQGDTGDVSTDAEGLKQGMSGLMIGSGKTEGGSQDKSS